ncbi:MAG: hypothetical protein HRU78_07940 [Gammaproteobacteria bacterium]|nr:MAG: hypothetical protein HRU78_07940 [Gammaproteobacteria bacterium]
MNTDVKQIIKSEEVMAEVHDIQVQQVPFVQKAGLKLAAAVGVVIAIVTLSAVYLLISNYPQAPTLNSLENLPKAEEALKHYKELSSIAVKSSQDLFQTIVTQALLPVFTAILGYIFAKNGSGNSGG